MTLIYFIWDSTCQWAHLQAATYHGRGTVPPAPPRLTSGKQMRLTYAAASTSTEQSTPSPQTDTHSRRYRCSLLCLCPWALPRVIKTCRTCYNDLHNRIQNGIYAIIRRETVTQRNRPGQKDSKKTKSRWSIYLSSQISLTPPFLTHCLPWSPWNSGKEAGKMDL